MSASQPGMAGDQPPAILNFLPLILMFGIFYFLLIRPQQKKQRELKKFLSELSKNQEIVTTGGIHGTIVQVKEKSVVVRIADGVKVEMDKAAVAYAKAA